MSCLGLGAVTTTPSRLSAHNLQVPYKTGEEYAKGLQAIYFETSAKDGTNVEELFRTIGQCVGVPLKTMQTIVGPSDPYMVSTQC